MNDPRPENEYGRMYTIEYFGNMVGGRTVTYNNQPAEVLMDVVVKGIKNGEPIWFGCDVKKRFVDKLGIHDLLMSVYKTHCLRVINFTLFTDMTSS